MFLLLLSINSIFRWKRKKKLFFSTVLLCDIFNNLWHSYDWKERADTYLLLLLILISRTNRWISFHVEKLIWRNFTYKLKVIYISFAFVLIKTLFKKLSILRLIFWFILRWKCNLLSNSLHLEFVRDYDSLKRLSLREEER